MSTRIKMQYLPMTLWYEYFLLEFLFLGFLSSSPLMVFNILLTDILTYFVCFSPSLSIHSTYVFQTINFGIYTYIAALYNRKIPFYAGLENTY